VSVAPEIQPVLDALAAQGETDWATLDPDELREGFRQMIAVDGVPRPVAAVEDRTIPGLDVDVPVRVYTPEGSGPLGVLAWFHGGGFVIGGVDTTDTACRRLCTEAGCIVVSVEYRLAPEHPYPAGRDDCWSVTTWLADHAAEIGGDPSRLAVGGDSAGGNLAAVTALRARDEGGPSLAHQLLVYPTTDLSLAHPSIATNGKGYFLTEAAMRWFADQYLGAGREYGDPTREPYVSPLRAEDLSGLAPAHVITAEFDPLVDEGDEYAARLADAGVRVRHDRFDGMIHGFFQMGGVTPVTDEATSRAAAELRAALG
jgi:acetyl esterase